MENEMHKISAKGTTYMIGGLAALMAALFSTTEIEKVHCLVQHIS